MADKTIPVVELNDHLVRNWKFNASPVAILNPESTMHERIAYCWGLASHLETIVDLVAESNDADMSNFASLISCQLAPLVAVLYNLGDVTIKAENAGGVA